MRRPVVAEGWLMVPYSGSDVAEVHLSTGMRTPGSWIPAYMDWYRDERVAKIRPPAGVTTPGTFIWQSIDGTVTKLSTV